MPAPLSFMVHHKFACSTIIYMHLNRNLQEIIKLSRNIWSFLFLHHKREWKKYTCKCNLQSVQWPWKEWNFTLNIEICSTFFLLLEICLYLYNLWCRLNLPAALSYVVQVKFVCTTIINGAVKFPSPLSIINDGISEIEICLHHYHLWWI